MNAVWRFWPNVTLKGGRGQAWDEAGPQGECLKIGQIAGALVSPCWLPRLLAAAAAGCSRGFRSPDRALGLGDLPSGHFPGDEIQPADTVLLKISTGARSREAHPHVGLQIILRHSLVDLSVSGKCLTEGRPHNMVTSSWPCGPFAWRPLAPRSVRGCLPPFVETR